MSPAIKDTLPNSLLVHPDGSLTLLDGSDPKAYLSETLLKHGFTVPNECVLIDRKGAEMMRKATLDIQTAIECAQAFKGERDSLAAQITEAKRDAVSKAQLNLAVNRSCSCGGRPPGTPSTCPACEVWHRLFGDLAPPKPVPLPAAQSLPSAIRGGEKEGGSL